VADRLTVGIDPDEGRWVHGSTSTFVGGPAMNGVFSVMAMAIASRARTFWERVGPRTHDVAFMAVAVLLAVLQTLAGRSDSSLVDALLLVVGLVGATSLWWRRSHPVLVTAGGMALLVVTHAPVVVAVGLFSLAVRRRDRVLALMTAAVAVTIGGDYARSTSGGIGIGLVAAALGAGFCAAAGSYVGARRDLVVTLRERAERAEEERELRAEQAKLGERARIAREMHDVLAHKVSLIALHAGALEVSATTAPAQIERTAGLIRTTAHEAMEDLRDVLGVLHSGVGVDDTELTPQPRAADIQRVVDASAAAGVHAKLTMGLAELPDAVARSAYRVVREGLTNVHKHARGAATSVTIAGDEIRGVTVEVVNQRPVSLAALLPGSGSGLLGLRERIELLGGTLEAGACADGGWRLAGASGGAA
jgi:signal transduction histidine kinase